MSFCTPRSSVSSQCSAFFSLTKSRAASASRWLLHDVEGLARETACDSGIARELQRQAFAEVARADAGGLEVLQVLQRDLQLFGLDVELLGQHARCSSSRSWSR